MQWISESNKYPGVVAAVNINNIYTQLFKKKFAIKIYIAK